MNNRQRYETSKRRKVEKENEAPKMKKSNANINDAESVDESVKGRDDDTEQIDCDGNDKLDYAAAAKLCEEMKEIVVKESDMESIKTKIRKTREYRLKFLREVRAENKRIILADAFPYFFASATANEVNLTADLVCRNFKTLLLFLIQYIN